MIIFGAIVAARSGVSPVRQVSVPSNSPGGCSRSARSVEVEVPGCLFRSLRADETPQTEVDINTQVWRCTAPATAATLAADPRGYLKYDGDVYQIIGGAQKQFDFSGRPHVVVDAQKQLG